MRILAYHEISDQPADPVHGVRPGAFREQMQWLFEHGYAIRRLGREGYDAKEVGIMFEDGYLSTYAQAWPVLDALGLTATVFVVTGYVGQTASWFPGGEKARLMDWKQIRELAQHGIQFGSHSWSHTRLTHLDRKRLRWELDYSRRQLEDGLGRPVELFSYPFSVVNAEIAEVVREAGYRQAFRFHPFDPATGRDSYGAFRATGIVGSDDLNRFRQKVRGIPKRWARWYARRLRAQLKKYPRSIFPQADEERRSVPGER